MPKFREFRVRGGVIVKVNVNADFFDSVSVSVSISASDSGSDSDVNRGGFSKAFFLLELNVLSVSVVLPHSQNFSFHLEQPEKKEKRERKKTL